MSGVAKSTPPQATKATFDKQESILNYNLPVKKHKDKNFWDSALNNVVWCDSHLIRGLLR